MKVAKLNIEPTETGVALLVEGASEGIHIEYEILPDVVKTLMKYALGHQLADQDN